MWDVPLLSVALAGRLSSESLLLGGWFLERFACFLERVNIELLTEEREFLRPDIADNIDEDRLLLPVQDSDDHAFHRFLVSKLEINANVFLFLLDGDDSFPSLSFELIAERFDPSLDVGSIFIGQPNDIDSDALQALEQVRYFWLALLSQLGGHGYEIAIDVDVDELLARGTRRELPEIDESGSWISRLDGNVSQATNNGGQERTA